MLEGLGGTISGFPEILEAEQAYAFAFQPHRIPRNRDRISTVGDDCLLLLPACHKFAEGSSDKL